MPRVKRGVAARKRKNRILRQAKGYFGGRGNLIKTARETVEKGWKYAYRDRRNRKREFRGLWITRITAACRMRDLRYSQLVFGLKAADIQLNRKMLSEIAIADPSAFDAIVEQAKAALN